MQKSGCTLSVLLSCFLTLSAAHAQNGVPVDGEYIKEWLVLGPFFPDDLQTDFLSDRGGEANIQPEEGDAVVTQRGDTLTWKRFRSNGSVIDLRDAVGYYEHATAYAFCALRSEAEEKVQFLLGSNDGASVWINGEQAHRNPVDRWLILDEDIFEADLLAGENRCLVKVSQFVGGWSFSLRAVPRNQPVHITPKFFLSSDDLKYGIQPSEGLWRYHPGDHEEWAKSDFDDSSWELVKPQLRENKPPISGWGGIGWFRLHLVVDSRLWNRPLALNVRQFGAASEVYLDSTLLARYGKVGSSKRDEDGYIIVNPDVLPPPKSVVFGKTDHVLVVRYSNFRFTAIYPQQWQGFGIVLSDLNSAIALNASQRRANVNIQMILTIVPIVFGILHLLLFMFYRRARENLYYALFTLMLGVTLFAACQVGFSMVTDLRKTILFIKVTQAVLTFAFIAGLRFSYAIFYPRLPKQFWIFLLIGATWVIWQWSHFLSLWQFGTVFIMVMLFEMLRVAVVAIRRKKEGAWIIGTGFIIFTVGFMCGILTQIGILPYGLNFMNASYFSGLFGLLLSMSIFLARNISRTEADNARKTMELEDARKLQLSMLPETIPTHPNLEIAVSMQTATEVGGDYYDFHLADNGTLTVAVGDATGHGMKAGTMVASMKSLFGTYDASVEIPYFFNNSSTIIKRMKLGNLYMAMLLVRITGRKMVASAAGMPPILIYSSETGAIEELAIKGMPLGGPSGFSYQERERGLDPGNTILLMSDGFPELFNDKDEMLDYPRVKEIFRETADRSADEIVAHLLEVGERWRNGRAQHDDITFVVLKVKDGPHMT